MSGIGRHKAILECGGATLSIAVACVWSIQSAQAQTTDASGLTFELPSPRMELSATLETRYDSNVRRISDHAATRRSTDKSDFRISPSLNADIVAPTSIANFKLTGYVGYDFYLRNTRLNRERIDIATSAERRLAFCDVTLGAGINRHQTDLGDLALVPGGERVNTVNVESQWRIGAKASCGPPVGFQPTGYVSYRQIRNSADVRKVNDANAVDYGGGLTYSSPAFGKLSAFAGRTEFDYTRRDQSPLFPGAKKFNLTYYGGKIDRRLGARLQAQAQLTYVKVKVPGRDFSRFNGLNWDLAAQLRLGGSTLVSLATARAVDVAAGFQSDFARTSSYTVRVERALSPRTRVAVAATRRKRNFAEESVPAGVIVADDRTDLVRLSVVHDRTARLRLLGYAQFQKRTAEIPILNYRSVQVGLVTTLKF